VGQCMQLTQIFSFDSWFCFEKRTAEPKNIE
jgi:hypothetical protein